MQPIDSITKLGKYGIVGVMLALIIALVFSMGLQFRMSTFHMGKTSETNLKVVEALTELSTIIKTSNRVSYK
jgi:predicted RND superfamily exporter protein